MRHRRTSDTEPMDRILHWAVQSQGQRRSISTELFPDTQRGWPPHPLQTSGGCSTITEKREVSWSRQHPSRTGPSRWRGCNYHSHDNLQQDLADRRMANHMDPVLSHHTSQERQPAAVPELPNNESASSVTKAKSCWRSYWTDWSHKQRRSSLKNRQASEQEGAPKSRSATYESSVRNISSTSKTSTMSS